MEEILKNIGILVGIPILRSISGWAIKALEDSKVETFEWRLLCSTVLRVGLIGLVAYLGLNAMGIDIGALGTATGAFVFDLILNAIKKNKK